MKIKRLFLFVGMAMAMVAAPARAAVSSWTGGSDLNWNNSGNWDALPSSGSSILISGTVAQSKTLTNNFAEGTAFGSITLNSQNCTVTGNGILLGGDVYAKLTSTIALAMTLQQNTTFSVTGSNLYVSGVISGGYNFIKEGSGTLNLMATSRNSYSGDTYINAGTAILNNGAMLGSVTGVNSGSYTTNVSGNVTVNTGATLQLNIGNNRMNIEGLNGGGTVYNYFGANSLYVGNNNTSGSFSGTIYQKSGVVLSFVKTGIGTQTLSGANSYTGTTTVSGGTLLINGTSTGSAFTVTNSGSVLGGTGKITPGASHALTVGSGAIVAPGSGGIGTLTVDLSNASDTATFLSGAKFTFELAAPGSSDELAFTGLTLSVADVTFNGNVIDFTNAGGLAAGTYTLFTFDVNNAYSGTLAIGTGLESFSSSYLTYNANSIMLTVVPEPSTTALLAGVGVIGLLIVRRRRQ